MASDGAAPRRVGAVALVVASLLASSAGLAGAAERNASSAPEGAALGAAIFSGRVHVPGRIRGHAETLPVSATRCQNCHQLAPVAPGADARRLSQTFGPALTREFLTESQQRRGGPASSYDAATLCRALRTGIDPSQVLLVRTMPLYEIDDRQCEALWSFLSQRRS